MKRFCLAILLFGLINYTVLSQQDPITSQHMFSTLTFNPGVAGTSGMICATTVNGQQWLGFDVAPSTILFIISAPIAKINSGLGLIVEKDN